MTTEAPSIDNSAFFWRARAGFPSSPRGDDDEACHAGARTLAASTRSDPGI
jgi:hypothetical protein